MTAAAANATTNSANMDRARSAYRAGLTLLVAAALYEAIARSGAFPPALLPRLADLGDKVLLGSDYPNIPYDYVHQLESLERLGLGDDWLRAVCWGNSERLFGAASAPPGDVVD